MNSRQAFCWGCFQTVPVHRDGTYTVDPSTGQYRGTFDAWRYEQHRGRRVLWCPWSGLLARVTEDVTT